MFMAARLEKGEAVPLDIVKRFRMLRGTNTLTDEAEGWTCIPVPAKMDGLDKDSVTLYEDVSNVIAARIIKRDGRENKPWLDAMIHSAYEARVAGMLLLLEPLSGYEYFFRETIAAVRPAQWASLEDKDWAAVLKHKSRLARSAFLEIMARQRKDAEARTAVGECARLR